MNEKLKIKIIEESGSPLLNVLQQSASNTLKYPCDDMENCLQCSNEDVGKCRKSHITYILTCLEIGCKFIYYGETNRNGYSRGGEHLRDSKSKNLEAIEKSVIANHAWQKHEGKEINVKMKMIKSYRTDPTGRQNAEAILIRNTPENILMNSKKEHIQPCDIKEMYGKVNGI